MSRLINQTFVSKTQTKIKSGTILCLDGMDLVKQAQKSDVDNIVGIAIADSNDDGTVLISMQDTIMIPLDTAKDLNLKPIKEPKKIRPKKEWIESKPSRRALKF